MHAAMVIHALIIDLHQCPGIAIGGYIVKSVFLNAFVETGVASRTESAV
jgi:hypothetical protein